MGAATAAEVFSALIVLNQEKLVNKIHLDRGDDGANQVLRKSLICTGSGVYLTLGGSLEQAAYDDRI